MAFAARPDVPFLAEAPAALIDRLRQKLRAVEAATGLGVECAGAVALGIPPIDAALGGGLGTGALHEIAAARETEIAAASGFALALAACRRREARGVAQNAGTGAAAVWIAEDLSLAENGAPYGPGLDEAGIAPERLIMVTAPRAHDVLWAMEEALRCRAVGAVIGEIRARGVDVVATRRLSLAAAAGNTLALLLRTAPDEEPSAAATRWIVGAAPSSPSPHGVGPPRLAARLVRNRRGHLGAWSVEWNSVEQRFSLATHSEPLARPAPDRPHPAAAA
ncbi:MAG: DNA repair protein [Xanthobacteraceae bacterium]|jgi:protein ImuA